MADNNQSPADRLCKEPENKQCENANTSNPRSSVRRRLFFGPEEVDEEFISTLQGANQNEERQRALEKWNFDFENEIPLTGDWEWEKVENQVPVPNSKDVLVTIKEKFRENRNV